MQNETIEILLQSLKELQTSNEYADLKIFCGDRLFSVHKALICPRSAFFTKACKWGHDGQPKSEINLEDDDPKLIGLMIDYIYQLDYDDILSSGSVSIDQEPCSKELVSLDTFAVPFAEDDALDDLAKNEVGDDPEERVPWDHGLGLIRKRKKEKQMRADGTWDSRLTQEMIDEEATPSRDLQRVTAKLEDLATDPGEERVVVNANMYALADKYGIEDLKRLARAKFSDAMAQHWKSEAFVRAAELVFENTPSDDLGLRDIVVSTLQKHPDLTDYEEVQTLLDSGNGIAWQLVKVLVSRPKWGWGQ